MFCGASLFPHPSPLFSSPSAPIAISTSAASSFLEARLPPSSCWSFRRTSGSLSPSCLSERPASFPRLLRYATALRTGGRGQFYLSPTFPPRAGMCRRGGRAGLVKVELILPRESVRPIGDKFRRSDLLLPPLLLLRRDLLDVDDLAGHAILDCSTLRWHFFAS